MPPQKQEQVEDRPVLPRCPSKIFEASPALPQDFLCSSCYNLSMTTIAQLQHLHFCSDLEPGYAGHITPDQYLSIASAIKADRTMRRWWGFNYGGGTGTVGPEKVQAVALYGNPNFYKGNRDLVRVAGTNRHPDAKTKFYRTYKTPSDAKSKA